ncbi:sugar nucleotide-binding protein [Candidatus Margulisiibacteriota bacterium]
MRIIIIGASGLIGSSLYSIAKADGIKVVGTYTSKEKEGLIKFNMLTDSIKSVIKDLGPKDVVFLLSAYSNPSWIFEHQKEAHELNVNATRRVVDNVLGSGARLIFMSSVEVFDGKAGNYDEMSLPKPLNLYGKMKYEIEKYLPQVNGNSCIVRTGWNVGWTMESRCVIMLTYKTLIGSNAKMAKDNMFSIIDVKDTAEGLFRLAKNPNIKKMHLASAPPVIRTELADSIIKYSKYGDSMKYKTVSWSDIKYTEPRARLNQLDNSLSISLLGMNYRSPDEIIRQKVELLDKNVNKIKDEGAK